MKLFKSKKIDESIEISVNFETTLYQIIKKSEKRAWIVAACACFVSICLMFGYFYLLPLKEKVPYLITIDSYMGTSSLTKVVSENTPTLITQNEAVNKSNIARYMVARESFDWDLISKADWIAVHAMSNGDVVRPYEAQFDAKNPDNPEIIYGKDRSVKIKIKSIVLVAPNTESKLSGATVRFDKLIVNKRTDRIDSASSYVATLAYRYKPDIVLVDEASLENPLRFTVEAYRTDREATADEKPLILKEIVNAPINAIPVQAVPLR
jgi:type IV secretion system protein VirB8